MSETVELRYDPYDYAIDADPYPVWRRMRDEAPCYRNEPYDFYALSRFEDVLAASLDHGTYSSTRGTVLELMGKLPPVRPMIFMDPPEHDALRKLVSRAFSPRRVSGLEPLIRGIVRRLLDPHVGSGGFDFVKDFGAILPVTVISSMLGIPEEDQDTVRRWTDEMLHRSEGETFPEERLQAVQAQLFGYLGRYLAERRHAPRDDMMTDLIESEIELGSGAKRRLDDLEILTFIGLLSAAGNETVARLLGFAGATLARFPDQRRKLVEDPSRIPAGVEELLRLEAPSPVQARTVMQPVTWHGVEVPEGATLLLLTASAGRDEREYPEPDRYDVDRRAPRHLAFGYGVHFCLGASLARLEMKVALEEVLARFPAWEVDWDDTEMVHTSTVRGYARVPIRL